MAKCTQGTLNIVNFQKARNKITLEKNCKKRSGIAPSYSKSRMTQELSLEMFNIFLPDGNLRILPKLTWRKSTKKESKAMCNHD